MSDKIYDVAPDWAKRAYVDDGKVSRRCTRARSTTRTASGPRQAQARGLDQAVHQGQEHLVRTRQGLDQMVRGRRAQRRLQLHRPASGQARRPDRDHLGRRRSLASRRHITYRELHDEVCQFANVLRLRNVKKGDRVTIYLPMIPEAAYAMLACARIGAIHSVVFGGFSPDSIAGRMRDCKSRVVITADEGLRGGRTIALKANVDAALEKVNGEVDWVIVVKRTGGKVDMNPARDVWYHEAAAVVESECPCEPMNAEDPLFILYTSGSTGQAQGRAAHHRRLSDLRGDDAPVRVRLSRRRHLLVHRRCRLGHRPQLHCLRPAGERRDHADVRGRAELSGQFAVLEGDRQAQGQHLLHRADRDPRADAGGRRAGEEDLARKRCACSARSASRSIPKPGNGITAWSATTAARSSIPGGRPKPAAS